ncbi:OLC1v1030820C1 [Oldenlandia corymbosa var. corymbosa]|uniref:OLC1v1030820C1 n=1 Tax=Oldenlandia corymbosa var. corymbosa TaxID=529605 RepID=A0AAV1CHM4_OLDCO|nr:OLC1v1030820C1 [Oldenlandia corymbosa var. corymbosa]
MRVLKWTTDFNPTHESSIVPVWISYEGLPIHRFDKDYLWKVASIIGTPLQIDVPTLNMSQPSVAPSKQQSKQQILSNPSTTNVEKNLLLKVAEAAGDPTPSSFARTVTQAVDVEDVNASQPLIEDTVATISKTLVTPSSSSVLPCGISTIPAALIQCSRKAIECSTSGLTTMEKTSIPVYIPNSSPLPLISEQTQLEASAAAEKSTPDSADPQRDTPILATENHQTSSPSVIVASNGGASTSPEVEVRDTIDCSTFVDISLANGNRQSTSAPPSTSIDSHAVTVQGENPASPEEHQWLQSVDSRLGLQMETLSHPLSAQ